MAVKLFVTLSLIRGIKRPATVLCPKGLLHALGPILWVVRGAGVARGLGGGNVLGKALVALANVLRILLRVY